MPSLIHGIKIPKINYRRFSLIAICIIAMMLTGRYLMGYSMKTYIISAAISAVWGAGLYIHLDKRDKRNA